MVGRLCVAGGRGVARFAVDGVDGRTLTLVDDPHVGIHGTKLLDQIIEVCLLLYDDEQVFEFVAELLVQQVQGLLIIEFGLFG